MVGALPYKIVVIGASAGGLSALSGVLSQLPEDFPLPVLVVQHLYDSPDSYLPTHLTGVSSMRVVEPNDKERIQAGTIYIAPATYHMELDDEITLSLAFDPRVHYSRPSIDVLFNSVADIFREAVIGIILTGGNDDGTLGFQHIKALGGITIAQDPETAEIAMMPQSAIDAGCVDTVLPLQDIAAHIKKLVGL